MNKPDFLIVPTRLLDDESIQPSDVFVYGVVYWYNSMKNGVCFASNDVIASILNMSKRGVQNSLGRLEVGGYIKRAVNGYSRHIIPLIVFGEGVQSLHGGVLTRARGGAQLVTPIIGMNKNNELEGSVSLKSSTDIIDQNQHSGSDTMVGKDEEVSRVAVNEDGVPQEGVSKRPKGEGRNKVALRVRRWFGGQCFDRFGTKPMEDVKGYMMIVRALKELTQFQLHDLLEEWLDSDKLDEELMQITRALSSNQINIFKVRNGIK